MPEKAQSAALKEVAETVHDLIRTINSAQQPQQPQGGLLSARGTRVTLGEALAAGGAVVTIVVLLLMGWFSLQRDISGQRQADIAAVGEQWSRQFEKFAASQAQVNAATAQSIQDLTAQVSALAETQRALQSSQSDLKRDTLTRTASRFTNDRALSICLANQIVNTESGNTWRCAHPDAAALIGQIRVVVGPDPRRKGGG